ncbi:hypothetical protein ACFL2H_00895 [Planctomycetota bacterium]
MDQVQNPNIQIDCESPESLRLESSEVDRTKQIFFLLPSWVMSLLAHAVLLLLLACVTFPAVGDALPQILTMLPANDPADEEFDLVHVQTEQDVVSEDELFETLAEGFEDEIPLPKLAAFTDDSLDVTQLVSEVATDSETGPEFFGAYGEGERFAFVIDRSSSMTGEKFEVARKELLKAVKQLLPHQRFYVVFFDRGMLEMFGRKKLSDMPLATTRNLRRAEYWIREVKVGRGTMPYQAIRRSLEFDPDTVFLLSDGQFNSGDNTIAYMLKNQRIDGQKMDAESELKMNTIGFYHQDDGTLKHLADKFDGTYRFVADEKE